VGKLPLSKVTAKRVIDYMAHRREKGMAPATCNNERSVLSKILSIAVDWDLLRPDANPMRKVPKFEALNQKNRWLTPEEQCALIGAASGHVRDTIILALGTGARRGEALALRWESVDLERAEVSFTADTTKSGKTRTIPANDAVLAMLKARLAGRREQGRFISNVFTYRGKPIKSIHAGFRTACAAAGLGRDVTFHTLRHTFCTRFGHAGGNIRDLQALAGHADISTTQRYYHRSDSAARILGTMAHDLAAPGRKAPTAG
ncbi:MAG: site-specific integrase, partial [Acidobacteria bacterium]|nr:site-specific integrase [Acidobacteriota bacterium]